MAIKLDLKNFKHVKSDKSSTTLQHPQGHTITLAHAVLSPENHAQLKHLAKMANGGQAEEPVSPAPSTAPDRPAPAPIKNNELDNAGGWSGALRNAAKEFGLSKAEGGAVKPNTIDYSKFKKKPNSQQSNAPSTLNYKDLKQEYKDKNRFKMAEGGNPANPSLAESKKSIASSNPNMMTPTGSLEQMVNCWAEGGGISEQGEDIRAANRAMNPPRNAKPSELDQHRAGVYRKFAKEEAKGRAAEERHIKPNLKGLAEGGKVDSKKWTDETKTKLSETNRKQHEIAKDWKPSPESQAKTVHFRKTIPDVIERPHQAIVKHYNSGGRVKMASGGDANFAYEAGLPCKNPHCKSHGKPHPNCRCYTPGQVTATMMKDGGLVYSYCAEGIPHHASCEYAKGEAVQQAQQSPIDTVTDNYVEGGAISQSGPTMDMHAKGGNVNPSLQQSKESAPKRFPSMALENLECDSDEPGNQGGGMAEGGQIPMNVRHYDGGGNIDDDFKNVPPDKQRRRMADGGKPLPVPGGGISPVPDKSAIDKLIDMKHAETMPKDEAATERDVDKFEAQQPPTQLEQTINDRRQGRQQDQQLAPEDQPAEEPDTEQPPTGPDIHGNDHYGHLDAQGNDQMSGQQPMQQQAPDQANVIPQTDMQQPDVASSLAQSHIQENQAFQQDLNNGHITPKTYSDLFHYNKDGSERSTLGKIGMIFGMMVGGAGSGLAHQPNQALQMMDNVIKNDLEAQKTSKANAQNFLKINQERLLNNAHVQQALASTSYTNTEKEALKQSIAMKAYTQSYMDMSSTIFKEQMDKLKTLDPNSQTYKDTARTLLLMGNAIDNNNAKAAAIGAAGVRNLGSMYGYNEPINGKRGQQSSVEQDYQDALQTKENMGDKAGADSIRAKHITDVPGHANKEADVPDMEQKVQNYDILNNKLKDVLDFAKQNRGSVNPQVLKQAAQKAHELTAFYNQSVDNLGMTPGRLGWLDEQIKKNPTSIIEQLLGNNKVLEEIKDSNTRRINTRLHTKGFDVESNSPIHYRQQGELQQKGLQNNQPQYKTDKNGIKWMRGPNGEAVRVK